MPRVLREATLGSAKRSGPSRIRRSAWLLPLVAMLWVPALQGAPAAAGTASPDPAKTRAYIEHAWSTLTRSMTDCASLADPKVATRPVLYLPAEFPVPAE